MTSSETQAWRVHALGTPRDALRLDTIPACPPDAGCARVAVAAVGLNFPDLLLCSGGYQERPTLPFSPGFEAAGVVVECGPGSARTVGEHVIVVPELPNGSMQLMLTVPDQQLFPVPPDMPLTTAGALHIAYATAYAALHRRAGLREGETLVVSGAAGGIGTATVQLGHAAGAHVIALASGGEKIAACKESGADAVVDLADTPDVVGRLRDLTHGRGAEVIVDVVGGQLFQQLRHVVAFEGRLVIVGFTSGEVPDARVNHALLRNYSLLGLNLARYRRAAPAVLRDIHADVVRMYQAGLIVPPIHRMVPFGEAPEGLDVLAHRMAIGRVVLAA